MEVYVHRPARGTETPMLVDIAHAGTFVPEAIAAGFASDHIRELPMTDWHLHELYDFLPDLGIETLYATHSRFVADLNRASADTPLYPGRFETSLVAAKTFWGDEIYTEPPDADEVRRRAAEYHEPYHRELLTLIERKLERFGQIYLIDAHSVASRASLLSDELTEHFYLGDRDGETAPVWLREFVRDQFVANGYSVSENQPFKGGYVTEHYGRIDGVNALQIEMTQRVYMDEDSPGTALEDPRFAAAKQMLRGVFEALVEEIRRRS